MVRNAPSALTLLALAVALSLPGAPRAAAFEPLEPLPAGAGPVDDRTYEDPPILRTSREPVRISPSEPVRHQTPELPQGPSPAKDPREARALGSAWLVKHQGGDGGWGAGAMGVGGGGVSDVATTSIVVLALARDGAGVAKHRAAIERGVDYVVGVVQASPAEGARLNVPQGTQPQYKLGQLVDTHMAALMLGEITGKLDGARDARIRDALTKVVTKVQAAQQANGSFDSNGWAPVLSSSIAQRSLYRARELGKTVDEDVLAKGDAYNMSLVDRTTGRVDASAGAGVELYAVAGAVQNTRLAEGRGYAPAAEASAQARGRVAQDTDRLIAGYGSIGGEEMLGYMMISDSLAATGGAEWEKWDTKIGSYLRNIQNADGSWSGHHCITSTVFVTAAAVMTLGAENVPVVKPPGRKG